MAGKRKTVFGFAPAAAKSKTSPIKRKALKIKPEVLSLVLEPAVAEVLTALSIKRGVDMQTLVRVALRNLIQRSNYYGLDTALTFGKYRGETLETVIRCDPGYVDWMIKTSTNVEVSGEALDLLAEMQAVGRAG